MEKVSLNSQFYFLKNAMKILLPVSVFSLVFPALVRSFHEFSSYFSFQFFTYSSERNYIFLLCNGILVFIIKNSGLISANISDQESHKEFKSTEFKNKTTTVESGTQFKNQQEFLEKVVEIDQNQEKEDKQIERMSEDNLVSVGTIDENEDQESYVEIIEELEEDEEETLEELHKKCEDFIKRIKSEINRKN